MHLTTNYKKDFIDQAVSAIKAGYLVAFPTETVYGLGADAMNKMAVSRIYEVKGRPSDHPLIIHVSSVNKIDRWVNKIPDYAVKLGTNFWPGPMTLILPRSRLAKDFITGGQDSVALRVPQHPIALQLIRGFEDLGGHGLAAPSANRFGAVSPTDAAAVLDELGDYLSNQDMVLDGGKSEIGLESTIIDCTTEEPRILRPGFVSSEMIVGITGLGVTSPTKYFDKRAPGLLANHYAPKAKVVLDAPALHGDGFLAMGNIATPSGAFRLGSPTDLLQFAKDLYSVFRLADHKKFHRIVVIQPQGAGLAEAIRDRLGKAATQ